MKDKNQTTTYYTQSFYADTYDCLNSILFLAVTPIILSALVCTCSSMNRFPYLSRIMAVHLWWTLPKVPTKSLDKKLLNYTTFTFKDFIFVYFWMPFMIKCSRGNKLQAIWHHEHPLLFTTNYYNLYVTRWGQVSIIKSEDSKRKKQCKQKDVQKSLKSNFIFPSNKILH